jgi:four helix bundle protein
MEALEQLDVWKRSCRLSVELYKATACCKERGFRDQITRAALSVPSNIAEGYERDSPKARVQFLNIAKGSCGELWTQLMIGYAAGFLEPDSCKSMAAEAKQLSRMLWGLIQYY